VGKSQKQLRGQLKTMSLASLAANRFGNNFKAITEAYPNDPKTIE